MKLLLDTHAVGSHPLAAPSTLEGVTDSVRLEVSGPNAIAVRHLRRIEADQAPPVPRLACHVQERPGSAADVEHRLGGHDHRQVEAEVVALLRRAEPVVQRRLLGIGEPFLEGARPLHAGSSGTGAPAPVVGMAR